MFYQIGYNLLKQPIAAVKREVKHHNFLHVSFATSFKQNVIRDNLALIVGRG